MAILLISHDLNLVRGSPIGLRMRDGQIVEGTPARRCSARPGIPTRAC